LLQNLEPALEAPETNEAGTHWAAMMRLLPDYILLTTVDVGDGHGKSFWHVCWLAIGPLADALPALYIDVRRPKSSVQCVMSSTLRLAFVPRLSALATEEFTKVV
jgi:hypothetical protein